MTFRPTVRFDPQQNANLKSDLENGTIGGFKLVHGQTKFRGEATEAMITKVDVQLEAKIIPTNKVDNVIAVANRLRSELTGIDFNQIKLDLIDAEGDAYSGLPTLDVSTINEDDMRYCKRVKYSTDKPVEECYSKLQADVLRFARSRSPLHQTGLDHVVAARNIFLLAVYYGKSSMPFYYSKRIYEFILPAILALVVTGLYYFKQELFIVGSIRQTLSSLFQFMIFVVPFHLAALGAFSTFQRDILDKPLKGTSVFLSTWSNQANQWYDKELTLRQYVSLLFGYLCSLGIIYVSLYISVSSVKIPVLCLSVKTAFVFPISFFISIISL